MSSLENSDFPIENCANAEQEGEVRSKLRTFVLVVNSPSAKTCHAREQQFAFIRVKQIVANRGQNAQ